MRNGSLLSGRFRRLCWEVCAAGGVIGALMLAPPASAVAPPSLEEGGAEQVAQAVLPTDRTLIVTPAAPATWTGTRATGHNTSFDPGDPVASCGKTDANYCDISLINVAPGDFYATAAGGVEFSTGGAAPGTDLDLYVYESDAAGNVVDFAGASAGATDVERVSVVGATGYYLVVVVYPGVAGHPGERPEPRL